MLIASNDKYMTPVIKKQGINMSKLVIKIGGNPKLDIRRMFRNPEKIERGTNTIYLREYTDLLRILTEERMRLIGHLIHSKKNSSISKLAKELNRKQEAISRDAAILERYEILKKFRNKQETYLKPLYTSVQIDFTPVQKQMSVATISKPRRAD